MKKLTLMSVLAVLCLNANSQEKEVVPLNVGDYMPNIIFHDLLNYKSDTASLKEFNGKWLILDFWGPYCKSCIVAMPLIDSLQKIYHNDIQFVMVTNTSPELISSDTLSKLFTQWRKNGRFTPNLPVTGKGNDLLNELFPHEFIPHYVWINKWGRVCAITTYHLMNEQTIRSFLQFKG